MRQTSHVSLRTRSIRLFLAALFVVALFSAAAVQPAGAQTNTSLGNGALAGITTGTNDTALGFNALFSNTMGGDNTATGSSALFSNSTGASNTATGSAALAANTTGVDDTATGNNALYTNTTGIFNTATGVDALQNNATGNSNIAVGSSAGINLTSGSNNIEIGNPGVAAESSTIRIGTKGTQTRTFIAGISNSPIIGSPVMVNAYGRLGVAVSSARYKRDIHDMGDASGKLMKLRPVTFRYKEDPAAALQYGLIAEEVERVYPELVTYGADGKVQAVAYHLLPAMLLNEMQRQARENQRKDARIAAQQRQIDALAARLNALEAQARMARPERLAAAIR